MRHLANAFLFLVIYNVAIPAAFEFHAQQGMGSQQVVMVRSEVTATGNVKASRKEVEGEGDPTYSLNHSCRPPVNYVYDADDEATLNKCCNAGYTSIKNLNDCRDAWEALMPDLPGATKGPYFAAGAKGGPGRAYGCILVLTPNGYATTWFNPSKSTLEHGNSEVICKRVGTPTPTPAPAPTPTPKIETWKQDLVDYHNKYRCMHGVPDVQWNEDVARAAFNFVATKTTQGHANPSSYTLSPPAGPAGENLAYTYGGLIDTAQAVKDWYQEVNLCKNGPERFTDGCEGDNTGHFTAMIWKDVTHIGCALNTDARPPEKIDTILVCRYFSRDHATDYSSIANMRVNGPSVYPDKVKRREFSEQQCEDHVNVGKGLSTKPIG